MLFENVILGAVLIFVVRVISITLATVRFLIMGRANKLAVFIIAVFEALTFGALDDPSFAVPRTIFIGIGMWLAIVMWFNVWFIIWPNQKKALGIIPVEADAKAKAARMAMLTSRINTLLSITMLYCMVAQQNGGL